MEAMIQRMESLLARLEGALSGGSLGVNPSSPSGVSDKYWVVSKEQMEEEQKAIQKFIDRSRNESREEGPPVAD